MTDENTTQGAGTTAQPQNAQSKDAQPQLQDTSLVILNQYVRDLSFENPNAPAIFSSKSQPEFNISVNMGMRHLQERTFELILKVSADSRVDNQPGFLAEVEYAGVFAVGNKVNDGDVEPLLYIEGAKFLYPFARHILAETSRMGGFPPVLLQIIDFAQLYRHNQQRKAQANTQPTEANAQVES